MTRTFTQHYVGGSSALSQYNYDDVANGYKFVKQLAFIYHLHYVANAARTSPVRKLMSSEGFSYDHMGRRKSATSQLQDSTNAVQGTIRVSGAYYNELGQLTRKGLHAINGTLNFLQNVDYRYNARGWLTNINNPALNTDGGITNPNTDTNDQFGMELKYDNAATPQYNGNIGSTAVKTTALSGTSTIYPALVYNYAYDKLNRLINAISSTASPTANDNFYNENVTYDVMGNITKLNRYDKPGSSRIAIDSLTYTYVSGNRIDRIDDLGTSAGFANNANQAGEYTYDGNGNQLIDLNKGLTQAYNMLNLPQTAVRPGVSVAYIYDATGRKLRKLSTMGSTTTVTEYASGVQYDYTGTLPKISFIQTEEGRARKNGIVYKYEYDLKDHLGNTRLTTTWDPSDASQLTPLNLQRNDYYAFGATIQSLIGTTPNPSNHYLYNHKELQDETGLYDYGARFYDPVIARWTSVDRLAEKYVSINPYQYGALSPIRNVDMNGDSVRFGIMQMYDKQQHTNVAEDIKNDLTSESGLSLSYGKDGQLEYAKDPYNGAAIVNYEDDGNGGIREVGSATARADLISAIDKPTTVDVRPAIGRNSSTRMGSNEIRLNIDQIKSFISGSNNLDSRTQGFGMTVLHEYFHTLNGGSLSDNGVVGAVETKMNIIRSELNNKGGNFGQRTSYMGTSFSPGTGYLPFDSNSSTSLQNGVVPANTDKFIIYKP